jgi:hypothetical protein
MKAKMFGRSYSRLFAAAAVCGLVLAAAGAASACVGARPLAMGGAFTGLADDANATYWNPAGLIQLHRTTTTFMHTSSNRDEINYQDYVGVVVPVRGTAAVGASWVKHDLVISATEVDEEDWYWLSLAYQVDPQVSIGLNIKSISSSISDLDTETGFDLGLLAKIDSKWTAGLLVQDVNEPAITDSGSEIGIWKRNWRPGFSYRPDGGSVATVELYDAMNDSDARSLRLGYERRLPRGWAVRAGCYGLGTDDSSAFTLGFGKASRGGTVSRPYDFSLDVAAMVGDIDTVLVSITSRF